METKTTVSLQAWKMEKILAPHWEKVEMCKSGRRLGLSEDKNEFAL